MAEEAKPEQKAAPPKAEHKPEAAPTDAKTVSDILQSVQIAIDTYDDIFSDFDPSPIQTRLLSDDFLNELHRRHAERHTGEFAVNFTLPKALRSEKTEALVKKRLKDYFKGRLRNVERERKDKLWQGILRLLVGVAISLSLIIFPELEAVPVLTILSVLIWYVLWSGFEDIFEVSSRLKKKQAFYGKLLKAHYAFLDQESVLHEASRSRGISTSYR